MGFCLKIVSKLSPDVNVSYISGRMIRLVSDAQARIDNIKEFYDAFEGARFYSLIELLGVVYFISTKMLMGGFQDKDKAKNILTSCFDKYVVYLAKYSDMDMTQEQFLHYIDARFANICNEFEMQGVRAGDKEQIVGITTEKVLGIYNKESGTDLKPLISSLYKRIVKLLSF